MQDSERRCTPRTNSSVRVSGGRYGRAFRRDPGGKGKGDDNDGDDDEGVISDDDDVAVLIVDPKDPGKKKVEIAHVEEILTLPTNGRRRRTTQQATRSAKGLEHSGWASINDQNARLVLRFWEEVGPDAQSSRPKRPHMFLPKQAKHKIQEWSMENIVWSVCMDDVKDATGQLKRTADGHRIAVLSKKDHRMCTAEAKKT